MDEITYTLKLEDCLTFSDHHLVHSPTGRRYRRNMRYGFPIVFLAIGVYGAIAEKSLYVLPAYVLVAAMWFVLMPPVLRWGQRRQILKLYREGANRSLLGEQRLRIDADGLTWSSQESEGRCKWTALERITTTQDYAFIYLSAVTALVIPRQAVTKGNYDDFVEALSKRVQPTAA